MAGTIHPENNIDARESDNGNPARKSAANHPEIGLKYGPPLREPAARVAGLTCMERKEAWPGNENPAPLPDRAGEL